MSAPVNCARCVKPWPQCISDDGLACLFASGDMLGDKECELLFAEVVRRGHDLADEEWYRSHTCGKPEPCWTKPGRDEP